MPNRRTLLTLAAAAPLAAADVCAARANARPDASVLALCAEAERLERAIDACYEGESSIDDDDVRNAAAAPIIDAQDELLTGLCAMEAATPAAILAKLRLLAAMRPDVVRFSPDAGAQLERLLGSVLRDAIRLA